MSMVHAYITPYIRKYKKILFSTILLGVLAILSAAMLTFTSGYLISRTSERPENILLVYIPIVAVRTFGISRAVLRYLERLLGHNAVLKIIADMRVKLYRALEPQALFIRSRFQTGDVLGTLADDIEHLQDVYIRTLFPAVIGLFLYAYAIIALALFDWRFALFMGVVLGLVVFVYPMLSLYLLKKRQRASKQLHRTLYNLLTNAVFGIKDWLISGREQAFLADYYTHSEASHEMQKKLAFWNQSRTLQLNILTGIIVILVGVWAGHQASLGAILPTYIAAFTLVTIPIVEGLIPLSHAIERIPAYDESLKRIDAIHQTAPSPMEAGVMKEPVPQQVTITFDHVSYRYDQEAEAAIRHFSLTIQQGEKIALLGKSGAGKSTLIQLLLGAMEPTEGNIRINGLPPQAYGDEIYTLCGVLNQKPYLFATTVENNMKLGNPAATPEEVQRVIRQVRLDTYLQSLPAGIRTQMQETGQRFSGGERQRIALARILLKNTPVVLLDEPTVGLDPVTEQSLVNTMHEALKEKTVIWITHHLTGIEKMDRILFLDEGHIAMQGTHEELIATNERYRRLYALEQGLE